MAHIREGISRKTLGLTTGFAHTVSGFCDLFFLFQHFVNNLFLDQWFSKGFVAMKPFEWKLYGSPEKSEAALEEAEVGGLKPATSILLYRHGDT